MVGLPAPTEVGTFEVSKRVTLWGCWMDHTIRPPSNHKTIKTYIVFLIKTSMLFII